MSKKLSTEEFIVKARAKHGDKYDYSKTQYCNQTTPVVIICPEHGEFLQRPNNHYMGAGCPVCGGNKRSNTASFIEKAVAIHGDRYDYSKVVYKNNKTKVTIICPEHGSFEQTPDKHLHGEGCPLCSQSKAEATNMQKYGVRRPLQNCEIHNKLVETCLDKYGVNNPSSLDSVKRTRMNTCVEKYGVKYALQSDEVLAQRKETCRQKYGGDSPFSSEMVRKKAAGTIHKKYGVKNVMYLSSSVFKVNRSKALHHTFHISKPEESLYEMLCECFGTDDVERQYCSDVYPYACDFYIISRDMYVELNASWTHGGHWYGTKSADIGKKNDWAVKGTDYYDNAVSVWSDKDFQKRETARRYCLNYVVFWDNRLRDAAVWFSLGCPDGMDWKCEYSWLPERAIDTTPVGIELTGTHSNLSAIAKNYQLGVFYDREIRLWNDDPYYQGVPLRIWLYYNRYKFLGKMPEELSDIELLRGFTISGVHKGYTVFDSSLMQLVLNDFDIKSVYDPCAGWGERMLCCYYNDVSYEGVDVNEALKKGYESMISAYGIKKQHMICADSALYTPDKSFDAVITCPPYHNTEIYTDVGAENRSYSDFLQWWEQVVRQCGGIRYFCFQMNNRFKQDMTEIVARNGFKLIRTYSFDNNKSSHFTRRAGTNAKKENETMLVFERQHSDVSITLDSVQTVKDLRKYVGLSQSAFSERFGVSLRCLQSWEQGRRNMPKYVLDAFKKIVCYEEKQDISNEYNGSQNVKK